MQLREDPGNSHLSTRYDCSTAHRDCQHHLGSRPRTAVKDIDQHASPRTIFTVSAKQTMERAKITKRPKPVKALRRNAHFTKPHQKTNGNAISNNATTILGHCFSPHKAAGTITYHRRWFLIAENKIEISLCSQLGDPRARHYPANTEGCTRSCHRART